MEELQAAIEALKRARDAKRAELESIEQALEKLETLGTRGDGGTPRGQSAKDFEDLGITAAAKRYLRQENRPRTTREILEALEARGLKTRSKNRIATVYATLHNSKAFKRDDDGGWVLTESMA